MDSGSNVVSFGIHSLTSNNLFSYSKHYKFTVAVFLLLNVDVRKVLTSEMFSIFSFVFFIVPKEKYRMKCYIIDLQFSKLFSLNSLVAQKYFHCIATFPVLCSR